MLGIGWRGEGGGGVSGSDLGHGGIARLTWLVGRVELKYTHNNNNVTVIECLR